MLPGLKVAPLSKKRSKIFLYCAQKVVSLQQKLKNMDLNNQKNKWRLPAEWEPQALVQLTWPHANTDWAPMLNEITETYVKMAREIAARQDLLIVAPAETLETVNANLSPLTSHLSPLNTNDTWARDHAFITLVDDAGNTRLLDYQFNGWGLKFEAALDNAINRQLYDNGDISGEYIDCLDFVLEGGSIESDGRGTIFTTSSCLLAANRN